MPDMPDKALGVVLGTAETVLGAVVSRAAAMDHAVLWSRRRWWARWLP
jgi:hypothetical protein